MDARPSGPSWLYGHRNPDAADSAAHGVAAGSCGECALQALLNAPIAARGRKRLPRSRECLLRREPRSLCAARASQVRQKTSKRGLTGRDEPAGRNENGRQPHCGRLGRTPTSAAQSCGGTALGSTT